MGEIIDNFIRAEFQAKGRVHYHIMYSITRFLDKDDDNVYSEDPKVLNKIKQFVADKISTILLERDVETDTTHALNVVTNEIDTSVLVNEKDFMYQPKPEALFRHPECDKNDPRKMTFDETLDYRRDNNGKYVSKEVHKRYRNGQLGSFLHYCVNSCWKYNRKCGDKTCRHYFPHDVCSLCATIIKTVTKRNNRERVRVMPARNNAHLQTTTTSALYHIAQSSNYDWQYMSESRGAAEYIASYVLKQEQPDSKIMQMIIQRMLRSKNENENLPPTLKDYLRYVGDAIISSTRVGTAQACWFLLGLDYVKSSRKFVTVNTLPRGGLFQSVITDRKVLSELPGEASIVKQPSATSQLGLRMTYDIFCKQQHNNRKKQTKFSDISFYAFLSNIAVTIVSKVSSKRREKALQGSKIPVFRLDKLSVRINRDKLSKDLIDGSNGFIIENFYYKLHEVHKEPVVVYSPHFSIDLDDERCCKSIMLMHLPWSISGEDGLLKQAGDKVYTSAVEAIKNKNIIKKFPKYFQPHIDQQKLSDSYFDEFNVPNDYNNDDDIIVETSDGEEDLDDFSNNYVDIGEVESVDREEEYNELSDEIESDIDVLTNIIPSIEFKTVSILHDFVKTKLSQYNNDLQKRNEITSTDPSSLVSNSEVRSITKYDDHDNMVTQVNKQYLEFGDDQKYAFDYISSFFSKEVYKDPSNQLLCFLSGEGGTGKTTLIKSLSIQAKIIFGKLGGTYDPLLAMAPTGSASNVINGYTFKSIIFCKPIKNSNGQISATDAGRIYGKLKGSRILVIDECSLLGLEDIYDCDIRFRAARRAEPAHNEYDRERRDNLSKLPFGGWHTIFCGDLFQLPPVGGTRIYDFEELMKYQAKQGMRLWRSLTSYIELRENFRCRPNGSSSNGVNKLALFLQKARVGKASKEDVEHINVVCNKYESIPHPGALWIAPTNAEVNEYNMESFIKLGSSGATTYRAISVHNVSSTNHFVKSCSPNINVLNNLFKFTKIGSIRNERKLPPCDLSFAVGQRVRVTQNLATQIGLFNGAIGTIVAFGFQKNKLMRKDWMHPTHKIGAYRLGLHKRQLNTPIIFVQMENVADNITCLKNKDSVIPFFMDSSEYTPSIPSNGKRYIRKQYPLEPCSATTTVKAQGMTAKDGAVFDPGDPRSCRFGHGYVSLSRCTELEKVTLLGPLSTEHFNKHRDQIERIKREYRRLESLPNVRSSNYLYQ
jgi:hypothetical protein